MENANQQTNSIGDVDTKNLINPVKVNTRMEKFKLAMSDEVGETIEIRIETLESEVAHCEKLLVAYKRLNSASLGKYNGSFKTISTNLEREFNLKKAELSTLKSAIEAIE